MIPKVIHYFWFGQQPLSEMAKTCIESWKRHCPEYEIKLWNEDNYDVCKNKYMQQTYTSKKYGFTVDYARLDIIYTYGGIYLDTDVEILKSLDDLLYSECFMGFESEKNIALGLGFGAEPGNEVIHALMNVYDDMDFILPDGSLNTRPSPGIQTEVMKGIGLISNGKEQIIGNNCHVYSKDVFNPYDLDTGKITITENTVSIHHYAGSWLTAKNHRNRKIYHIIARFAGKRLAKKIRCLKKKIF